MNIAIRPLSVAHSLSLPPFWQPSPQICHQCLPALLRKYSSGYDGLGLWLRFMQNLAFAPKLHDNATARRGDCTWVTTATIHSPRFRRGGDALAPPMKCCCSGAPVACWILVSTESRDVVCEKFDKNSVVESLLGRSMRHLSCLKSGQNIFSKPADSVCVQFANINPWKLIRLR